MSTGRCPSRMQLQNAMLRLRRELSWPSEDDALGPLHRERVTRALPDQPPLELREGRENVCHELARRSRRIDAEVQRDERPPTLPRSLHEAGEVEQRAREPIELGDDQGIGLTALHGLESRSQAFAAAHRLP